ncbi:hypothetical protein RvY_03575 [Ramazzottius varieornatus]|uniref:Uncharacterized protein n=1 Tax=Ramazzottius varieornatus TaxID=947166 RepID=A0A1D1UU86_RAMVA|nr:hypothetical protein RvY_03575 [Ramazzottius varieornatus]
MSSFFQTSAVLAIVLVVVSVLSSTAVRAEKDAASAVSPLLDTTDPRSFNPMAMWILRRLAQENDSQGVRPSRLLGNTDFMLMPPNLSDYDTEDRLLRQADRIGLAVKRGQQPSGFWGFRGKRHV